MYLNGRATSRRTLRNRFLDLCLSFCVAVLLFIIYKNFFKSDGNLSKMVRPEKYTVSADGNKHIYNQEMPLIFVGGVPRSGTTLMRALLDSHPDVRCGQETRVIPRILQSFFKWVNSEKEMMRLEEGGVNRKVLAMAVAQFCLEIIANHGEGAERLCNKDPLTLKFGVILAELFPNMKFIFMVRDGRATVHSIISRHVTISGFDLDDYRESMKKWNRMIKGMFAQCELLGSEKCLIVYYEKLVLNPKEWTEKILKFLNLPWSDNVLHHEDFINKTNGIALSKVERSTDQVVKAINLEALSKWVGNIPQDVVDDMPKLAPMLRVLGYDPKANPPNYEEADLKINQKFLEKFPGRNRRRKEMVDVEDYLN